MVVDFMLRGNASHKRKYLTKRALAWSKKILIGMLNFRGEMAGGSEALGHKGWQQLQATWGRRDFVAKCSYWPTVNEFTAFWQKKLCLKFFQIEDESTHTTWERTAKPFENGEIKI
jgi:hypothetical protein